MILLIDNYDSFTYNLAQAVEKLGETTTVVRNDQITLKGAEKLGCKKIVISPGPRTPKEAGISNKLIKHFAGKIPILGVCLGHQCLAFAFGGKIIRAKRLMHGKTSPITHDGKGVFEGLQSPFTAMRYHSLIVDENTLTDGFVKTAWTDQNELMGIRHREYPLEGVQFHPESFATECGLELIRNFLKS